MNRQLNDPALPRFRVPTQTELHIRSVIEALHEQGIRVSDMRCVCCHMRLVDLAHITMTADGPLGPECSKHTRAVNFRKPVG